MHVLFINQLMFFFSHAVVRNSLGNDLIFVHKFNKLYAFARTLYEEYLQNPDNEPLKDKVRSILTWSVIILYSDSLESSLCQIPLVIYCQIISVDLVQRREGGREGGREREREGGRERERGRKGRKKGRREGACMCIEAKFNVLILFSSFFPLNSLVEY